MGDEVDDTLGWVPVSPGMLQRMMTTYLDGVEVGSALEGVQGHGPGLVVILLTARRAMLAFQTPSPVENDAGRLTGPLGPCRSPS